MALTFFLQLDSIPGESLDERHPGAIELTRWSWGMQNSGGVQFGAGGGAGKVALSPIQVVKRVDSSSPRLMELVANGRHVSTGTLSVVVAGDPGRDQLVVTLDDIVVTSWSTAENTGDDRAEEEVALAADKVTVTYPTQNPDGSLGDPVVFGWDVRANQKV